MPTKDGTAFKYSEQKRKRMGEYRTCKNCQKVFYLVPVRVKRNEQFCSRTCQKEFLRIEKICPVCGKTFLVLANIADRYTVCSWECRIANGIFDNCERCGKSFRHHEHRYDRHYCSEECRRPSIIIQCKTCGKEFRRLPSDLDRQFCSFACYRRSNSETNLEKYVRQALTEIGLKFIQEARIGRYSIDFYFPGYWIALEVDGDYWHQDKKRDERKDKYLANHGIKTIHITEKEIYSIGAHDAIYLYLSKYLNLAQPKL